MFLGFTVQKSNILTILELRNTIYATSLELNHLSLAFLFSSQLEMFGSLDWDQMFKQLRVLRGIAENRHLSIAGNNGNNQIAQLLAGSHAGKVVGLTAE